MDWAFGHPSTRPVPIISRIPPSKCSTPERTTAAFSILNGSDYSAKSSEINNRISALRSERKKKIAEDEGDEQLDKLKELQCIIDEYEPTEAFDEDLFNQIIEKAVVMSGSEIAFHLIGGLRLIETIA